MRRTATRSPCCHLPVRFRLAAESARVAELIDDGTVEQFYVWADRSGAYVVVKTPDLDTAQAVTQAQPMAKADLLTFSYTELASPA